MLKSGSGNQKYRSGYPYLDAKTLERHTEIEEAKYILLQRRLLQERQENADQQSSSEAVTTINEAYKSNVLKSSYSSGATDKLSELTMSIDSSDQSTRKYRKMIRGFAEDSDYNSFYIRFPHNEQELECLRNISDNVVKLSFVSYQEDQHKELKDEEYCIKILEILKDKNLLYVAFDKPIDGIGANSTNPRYFYREEAYGAFYDNSKYNPNIIKLHNASQQTGVTSFSR